MMKEKSEEKMVSTQEVKREMKKGKPTKAERAALTQRRKFRRNNS